MTESDIPVKRRRFLRSGTAFVAVVPFAGLMRGAYAGKAPLDPASPSATALGYQHDGSKTDRPSSEQACAACLHFTKGGDSPVWGTCAVFPDSLVSAAGWCRAYTKKS